MKPCSACHGPVIARQAKTILSGGLQLAVMANVLGANPVRELRPIKSKRPPKGASALTADQLRDLLTKLRTSEYCRKHDLVDPFTLFIATGLRRGEVLVLRWSDFDETEGTIAASGKVERIAGKGLIRVEVTETAAGRRRLAFAQFRHRRTAAKTFVPFRGEHPVVMFPSTAGTWGDPNKLRQGMAQGTRRAWGPRRDYAYLPQNACDPHR